jgi:hypothetical protein
MVCHSNKNMGSMVQLMNLSYLRREVNREYHRYAPPTAYSQNAVGIDLGVTDSGRTRKCHDDSIDRAMPLLQAAKSDPSPTISPP